MADYIITNDFNTMEELWDDLLRLHWDYLDTEENMDKLKMRHKLEAELKEFLSIVQHDRKFFLTETAHVFKQSVLRLENFSAYDALMGFEAISQYANNLFRKPWRKEYRCIKMYSGYYQHEVKSNLFDAEKMFEAMGYTLSNHTLNLEGPICPDQVTNVSRDAMTAYVECQIMKQIYQGLAAMQIRTTWQDIFEFRETHIGTASQAIKTMAFEIEKCRHRRDKVYESSYSNIAPQPVYSSICNASSAHSQLAHCSSQRHLMPSLGVSKNAFYPPNAVCSKNCAAVKSYNHFAHSSIPHSISLDQYNDPMKFLEHHHASRHSIDQPFPTKYHTDCTDGMAYNGGHANYHRPSCALQNVGNLYNVPSNRYTLPSVLDHHYAQIGGFDGDNFVDKTINGEACCHQNPHYDCLSNYSSRKTKNGVD